MPFPDATYPYDQRLAKAAPDLLDVCRRLLSIRCAAGFTPRNCDLVSRAVAVIAKAEGRSE